MLENPGSIYHLIRTGQWSHPEHYIWPKNSKRKELSINTLKGKSKPTIKTISKLRSKVRGAQKFEVVTNTRLIMFTLVRSREYFECTVQINSSRVRGNGNEVDISWHRLIVSHWLLGLYCSWNRANLSDILPVQTSNYIPQEVNYNSLQGQRHLHFFALTSKELFFFPPWSSDEH